MKVVLLNVVVGAAILCFIYCLFDWQVTGVLAFVMLIPFVKRWWTARKNVSPV